MLPILIAVCEIGSWLLLLAAIVMVGDADRTEALWWWLARLGMVLAVWAIWPVSHTLAPSRPTNDDRVHSNG